MILGILCNSGSRLARKRPAGEDLGGGKSGPQAPRTFESRTGKRIDCFASG